VVGYECYVVLGEINNMVYDVGECIVVICSVFVVDDVVIDIFDGFMFICDGVDGCLGWWFNLCVSNIEFLLCFNVEVCDCEIMECVCDEVLVIICF